MRPRRPGKKAKATPVQGNLASDPFQEKGRLRQTEMRSVTELSRCRSHHRHLVTAGRPWIISPQWHQIFWALKSISAPRKRRIIRTWDTLAAMPHNITISDQSLTSTYSYDLDGAAQGPCCPGFQRWSSVTGDRVVRRNSNGKNGGHLRFPGRVCRHFSISVSEVQSPGNEL